MPTQSQDVSGDPSAITYSGAGETWKILKKVEVVGAVQGVHSVHSDSVLDNNGFISGSDFGVYFEQAFGVTGYSITNRAKGRIEGDVGIEADWAGTGHVVNDGLIDGKFAASISSTAPI